MQRLILLLDSATFMPVEHSQKEKEYGFLWRTAFKHEMRAQVCELCKLLSYTLKETEDPLLILIKLIKKDCLDAVVFDRRTQAD